MSKNVLEKTIEINTTPEKVWRVFTDPSVTRQMGGEYVTDWKVGNPFGWKGKDGKMYTRGIILQIEPRIRLQHNLFDSKNNNKIASVITYRFLFQDGLTTVVAKEELNYDMADDEYREASEGWDAALLAVKEIAKKL
jgi:uncharacterized protein YndB with AHSA1/START domain